MKPDLSSPESAVARLQGRVDRLHSDPARGGAGLRERFRSAAIRAFVVACERAIETIRRRGAPLVSGSDALPAPEFADPMRGATDAGVVRDAPPWMNCREMPNKTSHIRNADGAQETAAATGGFLRDMQDLLAAIGERNRAAG